VIIARIATIYYYLHFWVLMPIIGKLERPLPLPTSISASVLGPSGAAAATPSSRGAH